MKKLQDREYHTFIEYLFHKKCKTFTFQVTDNCNLKCSYCYQINKCTHNMTFEMGKNIIDFLFLNRQNPDFYFNEMTTEGLIIEFIGGEPLLQWPLIKQLIEYFEIRLYTELPVDHPWVLYHQYSICSNGLLYFNEDFLKYREKMHYVFSVGITVDGNKELHDKCRVDLNGQGSYDRAVAAAIHNKDVFKEKATKITFSPENISYTSDAIINMITLGFDYIMANPCYEEGWVDQDGTIYYNEIKKIVDYLYKNNLSDKVYIRFLDYQNYLPNKKDDTNWCGSSSCMIAVDYKGDFYPCIRFMESSVGNEVEPLKIGSLNEGVFQTEKTKQFQKELDSLTRTSQSPEKCLQCPIASGCGWCTGYNYQHFGTVNKRATYICPLHIAGALGTIYYNKINNYKNDLIVPKEMALKIISIKEYEFLMKGED